MAKVIEFRPRSTHQLDINDLLKLAVKLGKSLTTEEKDILVSVRANWSSRLEGALMKKALQKRQIDVPTFLCIIYTSRLLVRLSSVIPENWYITDAILAAENSSDLNGYQIAADTCFLICAVFPGRMNWRLMSPDYFLGMGSNLYFTHFTRTKQEVSYYMSQRFREIVDLTQAGLAEL